MRVLRRHFGTEIGLVKMLEKNAYKNNHNILQYGKTSHTYKKGGKGALVKCMKSACQGFYNKDLKCPNCLTEFARPFWRKSIKFIGNEFIIENDRMSV